jgi:type II restriction endonuclease TdeIII
MTVDEGELSISQKDAITKIVHSSVESFAEGFKARHEGQIDNPNGTLNMKIHNVFIASLGPEIQYYTALVRSLDSSLGNMLEKMAINIAGLFYEVHRHVEGTLYLDQTRLIAELLEKYKARRKKPSVDDFLALRGLKGDNSSTKRHESDYYLIDKGTENSYLIELKIGGDLDNKKARSEKEALLEQYAILSNTIPEEREIKICFATAYNRYGEGKPWKQERVRQFFSEEELLIGCDFWNFICKSEDGYDIVLGAYQEKSENILEALESIKRTYLGE